MTREDYRKNGFSIIEYDDNVLDWFGCLEVQLEQYGLEIEHSDEVCDGFEPFKIVKR